jgi:hypothetical protein
MPVMVVYGVLPVDVADIFPQTTGEDRTAYSYLWPTRWPPPQVGDVVEVPVGAQWRPQQATVVSTTSEYAGAMKLVGRVIHHRNHRPGGEPQPEEPPVLAEPPKPAKLPPGRLAETALTYVPVLLGQLDADGRELLGVVMQAMREGGYVDGFRDGKGVERGDVET